MSGNVEGGKESLEQQQLAQAMPEPGKQIQRSVSEEGTAELGSFMREMITFKEATERQLNNVNEIKVTSKQEIEELRRTIQRQREELVELREKLSRKDEQKAAAGKHPELQSVEDLQDSTVHKRPLFKRLGGCFGFKKKTKEKNDYYRKSDLPSKAEETITGRRDVGRHDEFRGLEKSFVTEETTTDRCDAERHDEITALENCSAEETTTGRRGFRRNDELRWSKRSFGGWSLTSGYLRREGSRSSRVSVEIPFPPRRTHSASSVVLHCSFNGEHYEDFEESREPIKIDKHPESQTAKEGSKAKFECRGQGKSNTFLYQWYKDGEPLLNEDTSILVLDPVRLRDFGSYMCHVRQDFYVEGSKSSLAKLNVIPDSQSGKRLKPLADLDYNATEKVCMLLQNKKYSLGGWREVAAAFEMESYKIDNLDNSEEPAKRIMEFVTGTRPNLTVYDFCKVLKENTINRLDVVNILEDHFFV